MKSTDLLKAQHEDVRTIFKQLLHGNGHSTELLEKLATSLTAHMVIEQELFYPAVLSIKSDLVLEGYEERAVGRFALKRLAKTKPTDRTFKAKVKTLKELIEHHIQEEEDKLFPVSERALGERSAPLCAEMKELFEATALGGYELAVGSSGAAIKSAKAPRATALP